MKKAPKGAGDIFAQPNDFFRLQAGLGCQTQSFFELLSPVVEPDSEPVDFDSALADLDSLSSERERPPPEGER